MRQSDIQRAGAGLLVLALLLTASVAQAAQTVTLYVTDAQGTVVAQMTPQGPGQPDQVTYTAAYRPYGQQVLGMPQGGPGYTGHVNDADSGLVYMQQRYYDPEVGRFLSMDPRGIYAGSIFEFDTYSYANNNPIRYVDPSGKVISSVNGEDEDTILKLINSKTTKEFEFDKKGNLRLKDNKEDGRSSHDGSSKFTKSLIAAIKSHKKITIQIASSFNANDVNIPLSATGEGATVGNFGDNLMKVYISGKSYDKAVDKLGRPLEDGADWVLTHELYGHAIPRILGPNTGNAIKDENQIRAQIPGSGRRKVVKHKE